MKLPLIISACLLGHNTKYNGKNNYNEKTKILSEYFEFIVICPESEGGLPTPRDPSEIVGSKVLSCNGTDVTYNYNKGAQIALEKALNAKAKYALLKSKSPSCGKNKVYDGTFTGTLIDGNGITASLLMKNNIEVYTEDEIDLLLTKICK